MKGKFLCMLMIISAVFFISPDSLVSAQENLSDYTIVDLQTGEKEAIDLDKEGYSDEEEFVAQPSVPSIITNSGTVSPGSLSNTPGIGVRSIIGTDDRWQVTTTNQYPYTTIARITVVYQDGTAA